MTLLFMRIVIDNIKQMEGDTMKAIIRNTMIEDEEGKVHYFDNNGHELHDGDTVSIAGGEPKKLYRTDDGQLGTDATNPKWIEWGRASECEFGIYALDNVDMEDIVLMSERI